MAAYYIGLMSGTSADAVDAALVRFEPAPEVIATRSHAFPLTLRRQLRAAGRDTPLHQYAALDVALGELFADAASALLKGARVPAAAVRAIGSHGQTVWHEPSGDPPFTIQAGDPNVIAERTGITTVADFRRRDVAAGGQGAPLVPPFHRALFGRDGSCRVVLNLGGIANITALPANAAAPLRGFDTGPANTLLDAWIQHHRQQPYDRDGQWAASGRIAPPLLDALLSDPYFALAPPKSTGLEQFNLGWLERHLGELPRRPGAADVQATLLELTARSVAEAVDRHAGEASEILVCGGGVHNSRLLARLENLLAPRAVRSTATYGVDPDYVEACAFAWLAQEALEGRCGNAPAVTGAAGERLLGGIYPRPRASTAD